MGYDNTGFGELFDNSFVVFSSPIVSAPAGGFEIEVGTGVFVLEDGISVLLEES